MATMSYTHLLVHCAVWCLLVAVTHTAPTDRAAPCCWPQQFEGKLTTTSAQTIPGQGTTLSMSDGTLHADYTISKLAIIQENTVSGKTIVIQDLKEEKMYLIKPDKKTCMPLPLPDDQKFDRPCFPNPPTATERLGAGTEALMLNMYQYNTTSGLNTKVYNTQKQCLPVSQSLRSKYQGTDMLTSMTYSNVLLGIKDPSVFELPAYCKKRQEEEVGDVEVDQTIQLL